MNQLHLSENQFQLNTLLQAEQDASLTEAMLVTSSADGKGLVAFAGSKQPRVSIYHSAQNGSFSERQVVQLHGNSAPTALAFRNEYEELYVASANNIYVVKAGTTDAKANKERTASKQLTVEGEAEFVDISGMAFDEKGTTLFLLSETQNLIQVLQPDKHNRWKVQQTLSPTLKDGTDLAGPTSVTQLKDNRHFAIAFGPSDAINVYTLSN